MTTKNKQSLLDSLEQMSATELRRVLAEHLTQQKLGLYWERNAIDHDKALNANVVLPRLVPEWSHTPEACAQHQNLIIEGDNFDSLRLLRSTHAGRIRVIYIDPPYNTGNKDWVYNDSYVGANDRWRHSQWLEFLYQRLTLARELLTPDGVILVSINDENRSRLELLMDEVFPGRRIGSLVWRTKDTGNDLTQRFSHVHEHVLVYANTGFSFNGRATDKSKFRNPDNDQNGDWSPQPLTKAHSYIDRENTYYPIQDPDTGYWYPCDPNRVWAYASEKVIRKLCKGDEDAVKAAMAALRSDTIEGLIAKKLIYFPPCKPEEAMLFQTKADLLAAIKAGKGPVLPKKKTPLLRADLPDLDFWVGKPIATGRPSRKEHWTAKPEADRLAPLGSWIAGMNEDIDDDDVELALLRSTRGGVATDEVKSVLGSKAFQHPKPLSLIKGLLSQATRPNDIVLDFFAGSGTTGQVVLDLNTEDDGKRRFILCSSTEATEKEKDKNLCRDVCAERLRRVMQGYADKKGINLSHGGEFGYLQLDKFDAADVALDATIAHAATLLQLRHAASAPVAVQDQALQVIARGPDWLLVLCTQTDAQALEGLRALAALDGVNRLVVVATRPKAVAQWLADQGVAAQTLSVREVLTQGQEAAKARKRS
jgi:adenine-specific DNA-methyltransferase